MFDYSNKIVLVAGATGGLGHTVAQAFLDAGAHLALPARSSDRLAGLFPDLADSPDHLLLAACRKKLWDTDLRGKTRIFFVFLIEIRENLCESVSSKNGS